MREKKSAILFCIRISIAIIAVLLLVMATFPVASAKKAKVVTSCNFEGEEINEFAPSEEVYVKANGLVKNKDYKIWIQDDPVSKGEILDASEDPSGAQETVTTDNEGGFGPTLIWSIPADALVTHHEYDIVVDRQKGKDKGKGKDKDKDKYKYNPKSDGLDSASVAGIVAPVPDVSSLILFASGLVLVSVYYAYGRSRREE